MSAITPELKAILDARAARANAELIAKAEEDRREALVEKRDAAVIEQIEKAAPFLDAGPQRPTQWPPSAQLKIGYCVIGTSNNLAAAHLRAERFVERTLSRARDLYRAGFYADPFTKEPVKRPVSEPPGGQ